MNQVRVDSRRNRKDRTENSRIQRLLLSEYSEFSEIVLVESPFAETTRNGKGIRQVALGLTPSRLIVAADVLRNNSNFLCPSDVDPSIESFELVSVYPLEYVTLSVFRRRRRRALKARFVDGRANYYELGGTGGRKIFWAIWCEHVRDLLARKISGSSLSETSAASSSSSSTLYLSSSRVKMEDVKRGKKTKPRIWAHYGGAGDFVNPTWPEKDLYLGPAFDELGNGRYTPVPIRFAGASLEDLRYELEDRSPNYVTAKKSRYSWPTCQNFHVTRRRRGDGLCDVLFIKKHRDYHGDQAFTSTKSSRCENCRFCSEDSLEREEKIKKSQQRKSSSLTMKVSRFGFGVPEKCNSSLILGPCRISSKCVQIFDPNQMIEEGVRIWEEARGCKLKRRHLRRYGLATTPHFLHGFGPWSIHPGERDSVQVKRSSSVVNIRKRPVDPELKLPVSRRQLTAGISCINLEPGKFGAIGTSTRGRIILFWTPEYWYRPRAAVTAYRELRQHLDRLKDFQQYKQRQTKRKLFYNRKSITEETKEGFPVNERSSGFFSKIFYGNGNSEKRKKKRCECRAINSTEKLKKLLRMDMRITGWDLDSTTLATQLTLIDRDLFLRIPPAEIEILIFQRSSRNTPNLGAWIAFSHRISSLTSSEILAVKRIDMRTRIITRFINAAEKCFAMGNFHSCKSILAGLQSPAIYRLKNTWYRLRTRHASRYDIMEKLCKVYKSPYTMIYQSAWIRAAQSPPCMPYVGDLLARTLRLNESIFTPRFNAPFRKEYKIRRLSFRDDIKNQCIKNPESNKECLYRRILASVLPKIRFKSQRGSFESEKHLLWTSKQQGLARKYFDHWNGIVSASRIRMEDEKRSRNMDPRRKRVLDVATWLADCQRFARRYDFKVHSFAWEFLLKARYREDRENFFLSFKLEPPRI